LYALNLPLGKPSILEQVIASQLFPARNHFADSPWLSPLILPDRINVDTLRLWVERNAGDTFLRPIPAIIDPIHIYRGDEFVGRFDIENQVPMDGDLSNQVLKYLEELGYKKPRKDD
jgi:hypothetical protein